jgi:hypothetical protein
MPAPGDDILGTLSASDMPLITGGSGHELTNEFQFHDEVRRPLSIDPPSLSPSHVYTCMYLTATFFRHWKR